MTGVTLLGVASPETRGCLDAVPSISSGRVFMMNTV